MSRRRVSRAEAAINFGYGPGQICPYVWAWFKGERPPGIAVEIAYENIGKWYAEFRRRYPDPPPPRGLEARPDLAAKLAVAPIAERAR